KGCVPRVQQTASEATEKCPLVAIAEIGRNDSDQVCAPAPKRTSEIVGSITELFRGFHDSLPSFRREACCLGDVIENHRDRRSRQTKVLGQISQCDSVARIGMRHTLGRGGFHTLRFHSRPAYHVYLFNLDKPLRHRLELLRK